MVVTTDDVERELQEEFARKAKHQKPTNHSDAAWVPQRCRLLLGAGMICALMVLVLPQPRPHLPSEEFPPVPAPTAEASVTGAIEKVAGPTAKAVEAGAIEKETKESGGTQVDSKPADNVIQQQSSRALSESDVEWVIAVTCFSGKAANCDMTCVDQGLECDIKSLKALNTESKMKAAVKAAGATCDSTRKEAIGISWDGPHVNSGECAYTSSPSWKPSCGLSPNCGWTRLCACKKGGKLQGSGPGKFRTAKQAPLMWSDVAVRVPEPISGDWASETLFLDRVLRSFGNLVPGYKGPQRLLGFHYGKLFDDKGMFAFDNSVKSVAIDVGAATNPLAFDLPIDNSQVAFFVEPVQWKTIEEGFDKEFKNVKKNGGCEKHFVAGTCSMERALVFPAAVSSQLGHAAFHVTANPYCGSLEAFTGGAVGKSKHVDVRGIFDQCYKDAGKTRQVVTISLKSILERIPKHIVVKYVKIDAQGHDFKVLLSAGDQMHRIEYVRFEMQVDPPPGFKLVKDIPSYAEVKEQMLKFGFQHQGSHACHFDAGASRFSREVKEMECVFCRKPPCVETGRPPMGPNPGSGPTLAFNSKRPYVQPAPWKIPASMETKEPKVV